jgi:hypothetical protein
MTVFDPRGLEWDQYCALMAELFASNQLGTVPEENWRDWVNGVSGIGYFMNSGVPDASAFDNWQDWAQQLVGIKDIKATA